MKSDLELFVAYNRQVYHLCYCMLQSKADAEDICQEVFVRALQQDRTAVVQEKPWLMRIAVNLCRNHLKRRRNGYSKEIMSFLLGLNGEHECPEDIVSRREQSGEFTAMIGMLPVKIRSAITLRYVNDLSLHEIAHTLDIPLGTVKSRIGKGLALMRKQSGAQGYPAMKGERCVEQHF